VPDLVPYGLHKLERHGLRVLPQPPQAAPGRAERVVAKGLRGFGHYEWWETLRRPVQGDLTLCWDEKTGVPLALRGRADVVTGVIWLTDTAMSRPNRRATSRALRACRGVFVISSAQVRPLVDEFGVDPRRVHFVRFGIDADFFQPGAEATEPGLVVSVGNDRHRDHGMLLSAMARVRSSNPRARLELVTRQPVAVRPEMGIHFAHQQPVEVRSTLRRGEVFAIATSPNRHVSGMTSILEAMACGTPVVAMRTPGMPDYVDHLRTGILVEHGDTEAFAAAIGELLADPARARAYGAAGRDDVESRFTSDAMSAEMARVVEEVFAPAGAGARIDTDQRDEEGRRP